MLLLVGHDPQNDNFRKTNDDFYSTSGHLLYGVGLGIEKDSRMRYVVKKVLPGGAAGLSCQIHPGDIIVDIDNHPTTGVPEHRIAQWVLGEAGALRTTLRTEKNITLDTLRTTDVLKYRTSDSLRTTYVLKYLTLDTLRTTYVLKFLTRNGFWARQVLKYLSLGTKIRNLGIKICNF